MSVCALLEHRPVLRELRRRAVMAAQAADRKRFRTGLTRSATHFARVLAGMSKVRPSGAAGDAGRDGVLLEQAAEAGVDGSVPGAPGELEAQLIRDGEETASTSVGTSSQNPHSSGPLIVQLSRSASVARRPEPQPAPTLLPCPGAGLAVVERLGDLSIVHPRIP